MIQSGDKIIQAMEKSTMSDSEDENSAGSGKNLIYCVLELVKGWVEKSRQILHTKIQQTKMLVMGQKFGDLFLFGLVWQYSLVQTKYNKGRFKVMATYLQQ